MAAELFTLPFRPALTANGIVIPGAKLYFYLTGTTTEAAVYTDDTLTTPLANPVVANGAGAWPNIFYDDSVIYRVDLKDEDDALLYSADPYVPGIIDPVTTAIEALVSSAAISASTAQQSANVASNEAVTAAQAAQVVAASGAAYHFFNTKAEASAAIGVSISNGDYAWVLEDESNADNFVVYEVVASALTQRANLTPVIANLGTIAGQDADDVTITGGEINGAVIAPYSATASALSALASGNGLVQYAVYVDTTNNKLKLATSTSTLVDVTPTSTGEYTYDYLGSNFTGTSTTLTDTGLEISGATFTTNSQYKVEIFALVKVGSGNVRIGLTFPSNIDGAGLVKFTDYTSGFFSAPTYFTERTINLTSYTSTDFNQGSTTWAVFKFDCIMTSGGSAPSGTLKVQIRNASGSATHTVSAGSYIRYKKLN